MTINQENFLEFLQEYSHSKDTINSKSDLNSFINFVNEYNQSQQIAQEGRSVDYSMRLEQITLKKKPIVNDYNLNYKLEKLSDTLVQLISKEKNELDSFDKVKVLTTIEPLYLQDNTQKNKPSNSNIDIEKILTI